ncbi:MAG: hypothetical protein ACO1SV_07490 [Fimbriimonas sp.]
MLLALCSKKGLFGEALASLLDHQASFQVVATERSPRDLINAAKEFRAQVMLVDSFELDRHELQFLLGARAFGDFAIVLVVAESEREGYVETPVAPKRRDAPQRAVRCRPWVALPMRSLGILMR